MEFIFNTTPQRSNIMKKIKSKNTKAEEQLAKNLWHRGIRYRRNYSKLPGKPDIVITKSKIVIFIDGEFWHGYNWETKKEKIKANREYWIPKIERTIERDKKYTKELEENGWKVLRFWEHQIKKNLDECVVQILECLSQKKHF